MRRVYERFAEHAFGGEIATRTNGAAIGRGKAKVIQAHTVQKKPFYDQINDIINEEIARLEEPKPNLVSWVKEKDLRKAVSDAANTPDISSIKDRFEEADAKYPEVHFDYFDKLISASSASSEAGPSYFNQQKKVKLSV